MRKCFAGWEVNLTSLMLQTWSRNSIWIHARHEPMTNPWYFYYDDNHISWIYLHPCMLSNPCRYLDESKSMRLQLTHILSNLYITKSLHNGGWRQGSTKPFKHPLTNSMLSFMIVILNTQVLFLAKSNPCRYMNWNSKRCSQLLMNYINLEQPTQVQLHVQDQHHHPRYVIPS